MCRNVRSQLLSVSRESVKSGFSVIELLIVVFVIGVLVALLLPAVQSARETARRTQCKSHLKQLGIAMHNYHESHSALPPGTVTKFLSVNEAFDTLVQNFGYLNAENQSAETPWVFQLLPYLDQSSAYGQFDFSAGVFGYVDLKPPHLVSGLNANRSVLTLELPLLRCPSDSDRTFQYDVNEILGAHVGLPVVDCPRGNYAVNWGNSNWAQNSDLDGDGHADNGVKFLGAPFSRGRSSRFRDITDGLDQSVLIGEVSQGSGLDLRGAYLTPFPGGSLYMSRYTPNGNKDFYGRVLGGDMLPFSGMCDSEVSLPCSVSLPVSTSFAGSRSGHRVGVHVLKASGGVQFVSNEIDNSVWKDVHSTNGNEVIDFF